MVEDLQKIIKDSKKEAQFKICLHPQKNECNGKIKRAHAIQNNKILNYLSTDGMLITLDGRSNIFFQDSENKGRKIATTFFGFCDYHDKVLFQPIEDNDFIQTEEQVFLYTYRAFCWQYYKKEEDFKFNSILKNKIVGTSSSDSTFEKYLESMSLGIRDNNLKKEILNTGILKKDYSCIKYKIWVIPYSIQFTCSSMFEVDFDLMGKKIDIGFNYYDQNCYTKSLFFNIFPQSNQSFCIISWLKRDDAYYRAYVDQFMNLSFKNKCNYLNSFLIEKTDKIVISPRLWKYWGEEIQNSVIQWCNLSLLKYSFQSEKQKIEKWKYTPTPWNLFDCSKKIQNN